MPLVTVCICISAVVGAVSSMFIQTLIDDCISPLLSTSNPDFSGLIKTLCVMGIIYLIGVAATLVYNRIMVTAAQGTLKKSVTKCSKKCKKCRSKHSTAELTAT